MVNRDMQGIILETTSHELHVYPMVKMIKRRKFGHEWAKAINEEVDRLLKIG